MLRRPSLRHDERTRLAARAALAPVAIAAILCLCCRGAAPPRPCPARFAADRAREVVLVDRLRAAPEGGLLLARVPPAALPRICFGPAAVSSITTEGVVLLDRELGELEAAARLGHLLAHAVEGMPMAQPRAGDCDAQVEEALVQEARALALELRLRRALGVTERRLPYAFEDAFWRSPTAGRERLVLEYLHAHPDGAPGLDGLASGYSRRCRAAR
jgi:hypothetical protein